MLAIASPTMERGERTSVLLVGCGYDGVEQSQLAGFYMYRLALFEKLGITFRRVNTRDLDDLEDILVEATEDVAFVMTPWSHPPEDLILTFKHARPRTRCKIIFVDYFAQTSTPYWGVLPYVDLYAKRQILRDRSLYRKDLHGGFIYTDWYVREKGFDIEDWHFGSYLPEELEYKVVPAWNLGVMPHYRRLLETDLPGWHARDIDLNARLAFRPQHLGGPWEWYQEYRKDCAELVQPFAEWLRLSPQERVAFEDYLLELQRSRMVFSPFGWGELCIRDFEAIACGALMMKPSMAHAETYPDIFVDGETYVALEWDLSDLEGKVRHYLEHPNDAIRIIEGGRAAFRQYFDDERFLTDVTRLIDAIPD